MHIKLSEQAQMTLNFEEGLMKPESSYGWIIASAESTKFSTDLWSLR